MMLLFLVSYKVKKKITDIVNVRANVDSSFILKVLDCSLYDDNGKQTLELLNDHWEMH